MAYTQITYAVDERIATITLDRAEHRNGFTVVMADELAEALGQAEADGDVRAIVLAANGKDFCVGMDLSAGGLPDVDQPGWVEPATRVTRPMYASTKPVIAAVQGAVAGVGVTMTLPADYRLAAADARFGFVFARRGLYPEGGSTWFLPRIVGLGRAMDWMVSGRVFDAQEALTTGLVHSVHRAGRPAAARARSGARDRHQVRAGVGRRHPADPATDGLLRLARGGLRAGLETDRRLRAKPRRGGGDRLLPAAAPTRVHPALAAGSAAIPAVAGAELTAVAAPRRRLEPDERREQILRCAIRLFGERPYAAVSTTEIAAEAGVTRGLVNHYFGTKRELYLVVVRRLLWVPDGVAVTLPSGPLRTRVQASVDWFLDAVTTHGRTWVAVIGAEGVGSDPDVAAILAAADEIAVDHVLAAVGLEQPSRGLEQRRAMIRAYGALAKAATREWLVRGTISRDELRLVLVQSLISLIRDTFPQLPGQP